MLFAIFSREIFPIQVEFDVQNLYVICNLRSRLNYVIFEILLGITEYWISAKVSFYGISFMVLQHWILEVSSSLR